MSPTQLRQLRSFAFAGLVTAVAVLAILRGADPTLTGVVAIVVVALFGGVEAREVLALRRALLGGLEPPEDDDDKR